MDKLSVPWNFRRSVIFIIFALFLQELSGDYRIDKWSFMQTTCGIFLYSTATKKFLIGHATRSRNTWSILKGLKDEGEDDLTAAVRELEEETGIRLGELEVKAIYPLPPVEYKKQKKILSAFLVIVANDLSAQKLVCHSLVNNSYPEIDKFMWVDAATLCTMAHETQVQLMDTVKELVNEA